MFRFNKYFKNNKILFIAEFGNAFEGKKKIALEMIEKSVDADVDALKFQIFFTDELLVPQHPKYNIFKQLETKKEDWFDIFEYAYKTNKLIFVDVYGEQSFDFSKNFKIDAYKIAPSEMTNYSLIDKISSNGYSLLLSDGSTSIEEIEKVINICKKNNMNDYIIMHGFQGFPTKIEDTNLKVIKHLEKLFHCPIGYADHIDGSSDFAIFTPLLAISLGAKVIEKHFTLNRDMKGIDYQSSVNPNDLKKIVKYSKNIDLIFGKSYKTLSLDEINYKKDVRKRIIANKKLTINSKISENDITFKRSTKGLFAEKKEKIIGKIIKRDIEKNHVFELSDFIKITGLIAVRMKSKRLKNKALLKLNDMSLIVQLIQRLQKSEKLDDIILCTSTHPDDEILLKIAKEQNIKSFDGDKNDVMNRFIQAGEKEKSDIIVRITGDNPLTDPKLIDIMVESHIKTHSDYTRINNLPIGITSEVITFSALKKAFQMAKNTKQSEYMTNYFIENPDIFKLNILQPNNDIKRPQYRLTVDYSEDYRLMQEIFNYFKNNNFLIKDVIDFLDNNSNIAKINSNIKQISMNTKQFKIGGEELYTKNVKS